MLMNETVATSNARPWWDRFTPRAGVRVQMFAAAIMWLVGLSFLLVRGVLFIFAPGNNVDHPPAHWVIMPIIVVAIVIGMLKARYILIKYADKAIARIQHRGHACFFGFFGWTSWLFIGVMMGGGIALRSSPLVHYSWGLELLSVLYIAVGTALLIADRIFWLSALRSMPIDEPHEG
jgi:hypothetical protein